MAPHSTNLCRRCASQRRIVRTLAGWVFLAGIVLAPRAAEAADFAGEVDEAKAAYFEGDLERALDAFQALQLRALQEVDDLPWDEVVEALTYLGELHVKLGDDDAAKRVFRYVLERDIDTLISPYRHPIEVVFLFNQVRDKILAERAMEAPEPVHVPPPRWHAHLPLGLPQLAQGRTAAGIAFGVSQLAVGGVSIAMFADIPQVSVDPIGHPRGWSEEEVVNRGAVRKYAIQWPATFGFYTLWAVSVLDARGHWRREHAPPTVTLSPGAGGRAGLSVSGRF